MLTTLGYSLMLTLSLTMAADTDPTGATEKMARGFLYKTVEFEGESWVCLRTYHDGHKELDPVMLFNLTEDPYMQQNLVEARPDLVDKAMGMLAEWHHEMMLKSETNIDPLMTVLREGGPSHTRYQLPAYLERLRETGRAHHAERLAKLHPDEV